MSARRVLTLALGASMAAATAAAQDYTHPRDMQLPAPAFQRPDPGPLRQELANGLVAYVVEDHTVPLASVTAFVGAGWADAARAGGAKALERALRDAGAHTSLRAMAAEYLVEMTPERTTVSLNVPSEDAWAALAFLARTLRSPDVGSRHVEAVRTAEGPGLPSDVAAGESGPVLYEGSLAAAVDLFHAHLFRDHPFGASDPAGAPALSPADARAFHRDFFVPANVVLAVSGAFPASEARAAVERELGDWEGRAAPERQRFAEARTSAPRRVHAYPADKLQAWVVLGHELPEVPLRDEAALHVMNYVLGGGHFDARLWIESRDKRGLTNTNAGWPEPHVRGPGSYTFRTYARPEVVPFLIELTLREIERIREEPVTAEELFVAKGALADGEHAMRFADGHSAARSLALEWLEHRSHDRSADYPSRVRAVTAEQVRAAARRYLDPERMQIVLVGPLDRVVAGSHPEGTLRLEEIGEVVGPGARGGGPEGG